MTSAKVKKAVGGVLVVVGSVVILYTLFSSMCAPGSANCGCGYKGCNNNEAWPGALVGGVMAISGIYVGGWQNTIWGLRAGFRSGDGDGDDEDSGEHVDRDAPKTGIEGSVGRRFRCPSFPLGSSTIRILYQSV